VVHLHFIKGGDTLDFLQASDQVYRSLFRDPLDYLRLVFLPNHWYISESLYHYNQAINRYGDESTFFIIRLLALTRLVSLESYWAQLILFSFLTLPGILLMYKMFVDFMQLSSRWAMILLIYMPATAFWIHGVHKEALLFSALGFACYPLMQVNKKSWLLAILGLAILAIIRSHYLLLILPMLVSFRLHQLYQFNLLRSYLSIMIVASAFLISIACIAQINPIDYIYEHRAAYAMLNQIQLNPADLFQWFAASIWVVLFSPLFSIGAHTTISVWLLSSFTILYILCLIYPLRENVLRLSTHSLIIIAAACIEFIIIGVIVLQDGAIARYRAPMLCLFMAGVLSMYQKKNRKILSKITKKWTYSSKK
jgi:hypothetical protein